MQINRIYRHRIMDCDVPPGFQTCCKRLRMERTLFPELPLTPLTTTNVPNHRIQWILTIPGPKDSPYAGRTYDLAIQYESTYPFRAPVLQFKTPLYHPNITHNGLMSNLMTEAWTPYNTIQTIYDRAVDLLKSPIKEYPYNEEAAALWGTPEFQARVVATAATAATAAAPATTTS